ncbi:MAG: hypothetical protein Q8P41_15750 [Pseudomonadota bacterium]|nr:hypothetical protein [Pseudomonadota bacterium]
MATDHLMASNVHHLVVSALAAVRARVEAGDALLSSEDTLKFAFAWQLGRLLGFNDNYRFDFEVPAFAASESEDMFLDLLAFTDPRFRVAFEFKLPKASVSHNSNSTQTRAKICRDIARLTHLVHRPGNDIQVGYFICATDERAYVSEGKKRSNPHYKTYDGTSYPASTIIEPGRPPNGIDRPLSFPPHDVRFAWEGIENIGRAELSGRGFAWLKPIKVSQGWSPAP